MEMCWRYEPSERPTVRELRIMLLHLVSSKHQGDLDFFEEKWNQLKPKQVSNSESQASFADLQYPENRHKNFQESRDVGNLSPSRKSSPYSHSKETDPNSFPILAPLGKEELNKSRRVQADSLEDSKSEASQLTGTEDGFEILSVGSRRKAEDGNSIDKDKFSFIHSEEVADAAEGKVESSNNSKFPSYFEENPDQSRSPARPNFVDLSGPGSTSKLSVETIDSRNLMEEFSPMAPLSDSSLLKMDKYTNYLCTAVTSMETDDSFFEGSRTKNSSEVSLRDSLGSLK